MFKSSRLLLAGLLLLAGTPSLKAEEATPAATAAVTPASPEAAVAYVNQLGDKALSILSNKSITDKETQATFQTMLKDNFDIATIARFAMGRYWNRATPEQKTAYNDLFEQLVVGIYNDRFRSFKTGIAFKATKGRAAEGQDFMVESEITSPDSPPVKIDWRVRQKGDKRFMIVDVIVEGVSMALTQRSEFAAIIQRGGDDVGALISSLQTRVTANKVN